MPDAGIALILAARAGDLDAVRRLLDEGVPIDTKSTPGKTPLMEACRYGHLEVARELMDRGAALRGEDHPTDNDPLELALRRGHREIEEEIVRRRRELPGAADHRWPASSAVYKDRLDLLRLMAELGVPLSQELLHQAASQGRVEIVRWFLARGADPNHPCCRNAAHYGTALDFALDNRKSECAEILRVAGGKTGPELGVPQFTPELFRKGLGALGEIVAVWNAERLRKI